MDKGLKFSNDERFYIPNYARNLPVYLRDLSNLKVQHRYLYDEFAKNGTFMGQKRKKAFSKIPIDQCTEHMVCWLKQESAVIDNLDNPMTIRCEQVSRPELAHIVSEFECKEPDIRYKAP